MTHPCTVAGCDRAGRARGYCEMHYRRWWRRGNPHTALPRGKPPRIDPALIQAARELLAEGAPLTATAETLSIAPSTLRNYGLVGISHREAGSLGRAVRIHNQKVSRM